MKKVFLVDLDNTLLDIDAFKKDCEECFIKTFNQTDGRLLWSVYSQVRKERGFVDLLEISQRLAKKLKLKNSQEVDNLFYKTQYRKYLFPRALEFLEYLKTLGKVKILSLGEEKWQSLKIKGSGIEKIVGKENIHISTKKNEKLVELIKQLKNEGVEEITVIDDKVEVLEKACQADKKVCGLWIKYGWYKGVLPQNTVNIQFEAQSLEDIFNYLKNQHLITKLDDLKIKLGILPKQLRQLIKFTNKDQAIKNFTSDLERFKNKKTFSTWLEAKQRIIYALTGEKDNLLGFLWFSHKQMPKTTYPKNFNTGKYQLTFAIRIYGKARGKGLARPFMDAVFKNYLQGKNSLGVWGTVSVENKPAVHLYKSFGFKEIAQDKKHNKIVMIYGN